MLRALTRANNPERLSLSEVVERYPEVPRLIALKIDVQRRGVSYTEFALQHVSEAQHQLRGTYIFGSRDAALTPVPESLILRDGTTVLTDPTPLEQNPYLVDWSDNNFVLRDGDAVVDTVDLWPQPAFYGKVTSRGTQMKHVFTARPQRLNLFTSSFCHFWANEKGCQFCDIVPHLKQQKKEWGIPTHLHPDDVEETLREALKEPGRFTSICLTAGSDTHGEEVFDREVDYYIKILQAAGRVFRTKKFPSQLIGSAYNERQLRRLHEETGLTSYTSDLEVLNERLFDWICPGKAQWVGYREWKRRLVAAVDVFGRGNVGTGLVGGVETAKPHGFANEEEALKSTLDEAEDLASQGVTAVYIVWVPRPGSLFKDQSSPSLE
ncbi:MAG TPA: radical SAM protein, partial [Polyangiaceae bacterium]|nr:radical SAM protein [Polyangiaceae bacterium]